MYESELCSVKEEQSEQLERLRIKFKKRASKEAGRRKTEN